MTDEEIQALQDELKVTKGELGGLRAEKKALAGELESRNTKITELEAVVAEKDERLGALDDSLSQLNDSLSRAVSNYKALVVKSNPGILDELITGDTIEVINQSLETTKTLIGKVRSSIEQEIAAAKVPAGAPARTLPDLSALSPREKIQYAIKRSP